MNELDSILAKRNILEISKQFGWLPQTVGGRPGWSMPLWYEDGALLQAKKWKASDGLKPKNKILYPMGATTRETLPAYYMPPFALEAIRAKSEVWFMEGEPDVLSAHALGYANAISWLYGAKSLPPTLVDDLKRWGVFKVHFAPDLDAAGVEGAVKLYEAINGHGFSVSIKTFPQNPERYGTGFDFNDCYLEYGNTTFETLLEWDIDAIRKLLPAETPANHELPTRPALNQMQTGTPNPRIGEALNSYALGQGGKVVQVSGQPAIPILSIFNHQEDKPGDHAHYFPESQDAYDYAAAKWIGTQELVKIWKIDVDGLGGWFVKPPQRPTSLAIDNSQPPDDETPRDLFITQSQVMRDWVDYFEDLKRLPNVTILANPFRHLHTFGGLGKFLPEGMVWLMLGTTGGKKSVLLENLLDNLIAKGHTGVSVTGEWTPHNYGLKAITRHSGVGMDALFEDMVARQYLAQGKDLEAEGVSLLSHQSHDSAMTVARNLARAGSRGWGELILYNAKYSQYGFSTILEQVARKIHIERAMGKKVSWVAVDYAQYYGDDNTYKGQNIPEHILSAFKLFCTNERLVGLMTSQITKQAQKDVGNGEKISIADGLGLRSDKANLVTTIENVGVGSVQLPYKKITVAKNSLGITDSFYVQDAPGGNHLKFNLDLIGDRYKVEAELAALQAQYGKRSGMSLPE